MGVTVLSLSENWCFVMLNLPVGRQVYFSI
jgi:hypothetical protein